jgi:hypothetical protein
MFGGGRATQQQVPRVLAEELIVSVIVALK